MKPLVTTLFLLSLSIAAMAQPAFQRGDAILSFSGERFNHSNFEGKRTVSVDVQYFHRHWMTFNYRVGVGPGYVHMPAGIPIAVAYLLSGACTDGSEFMYMMILPEGLGFNVELSPDINFAPYANPLGFDIRYGEGWDEQRFTGAFGARINANFANDLVFSPFAEYVTDYGYPDRGFRTGMALGLALR